MSARKRELRAYRKRILVDGVLVFEETLDSTFDALDRLTDVTVDYGGFSKTILYEVDNYLKTQKRRHGN